MQARPGRLAGSLRGALIHTHTEHNHTCGEIEDRAFIVTTHHVYAFRQWFRLPPGSLNWQTYTRNQRVWDWIRVGIYGDFGMDFGV